jgi:hypothetical protein
MWITLPVAVLLAILVLFAWTVYDHVRLSRMPEPAAAAEVYRRLRLYGKQLAAAAEVGDTPYEFAAILSRRLEELSIRGIGSGLGLSAARQVQAIADRIVRVSYSPSRPESPRVTILSQWRRLRLGLGFMLVLKYWKSWGKYLSGSGERNPDASIRAGIDYNPGEDQEE